MTPAPAAARSGRILRHGFAALLVALPLVSVGTIPLGARLPVPDLLAAVLLVVLLSAGPLAWDRLLASRRTRLVTAVILLTLVAAAFSTVLGVHWVSPSNLWLQPNAQRIVQWQGEPAVRGALELVKLGTCASGLLLTIAVASSPGRLMAACRFYVAGAVMTSLYALYCWAGILTGVDLPMIQGTFANASSLRVGGTFPEPTALAGFLLTSLVATLWLLDAPGGRGVKAGLWWAAAAQLLAALASLSALLAVGLVALGAAVALQANARTGLRIGLVGTLALVVIVALVPSDLVTSQFYGKVFSGTASWFDRLASWRTALALFLAYPLLGVGAGQYAYNQAAYFPPDMPSQFMGGRVSSIALEVLSELGLVGGLCLAVLVGCAALTVFQPQAAPSTLFRVRAGAVLALAVLLVLGLGYYTSRYVFLWVFLGLTIAAGAAADDERAEARGLTSRAARTVR